MSRKMRAPDFGKFARQTRRLRIAKPSDQARLELECKVHYAGSPYHKRDPGDFGLTPPSSPRPDKTLCDSSPVRSVKDAIALLREGVRQGLWDDRDVNGFPRTLWCVVDEHVYEARCSNAENGEYHGYPLLKEDAFRLLVIERYAEFWPNDDA